MTTFKTLSKLFVLLLLVSLTIGCATKGRGPQGAHALAEKGDASFDTTPRTGNGTADPFPEHPVGGAEIPINQLPGGENLCPMIHFDYDKSNIKPEWTQCLDNVAAFFQQNTQYTLIIDGHCDERGTNEYNMALGERRSESPANYLVQRGLAPNRIIVRSSGEESPLAPCHDESCWSVNRRAEFYATER